MIGRKRLLGYGSSLMLICHVISARGEQPIPSRVVFSPRRRGDLRGVLILLHLAFGAAWGPVSWPCHPRYFQLLCERKELLCQPIHTGCKLFTYISSNNFVVGLIVPVLCRNSKTGSFFFFGSLLFFFSGL